MGITKQAHHKAICRERALLEVEKKVIQICDGTRKVHHRMGCRKIYEYFNNDLPIGRDKFMLQCRSLGLIIKRKRSPHVTTDSSGKRIFPNLSDGLQLTGPNQLWQSDIFYVPHEGKHRYGFTIIDVYSRKLLALELADNLRAENLYSAIEQAIKCRKGNDLKGCIFHSDGGKQYEEEKVQKLLLSNGLKQSMCVRAQQNAYVERVQGTIKHEYLYCLDEKFTLKKKFKEALKRYNKARPHNNLNGLSPEAFEQKVQTLSKRPRMQVYQWKEPKLVF